MRECAPCARSAPSRTKGTGPRPHRRLPQGIRSRPANWQPAVETLGKVPNAIACPLCRPSRDLGLLDPDHGAVLTAPCPC